MLNSSPICISHHTFLSLALLERFREHILLVPFPPLTPQPLDEPLELDQPIGVEDEDVLLGLVPHVVLQGPDQGVKVLGGTLDLDEEGQVGIG